MLLCLASESPESGDVREKDGWFMWEPRCELTRVFEASEKADRKTTKTNTAAGLHRVKLKMYVYLLSKSRH